MTCTFVGKKHETDSLHNSIGGLNLCPFLKKSGESQYWYQNDNTGVYFSFDVGIDPDVGESMVTARYSDVGLAFNINYARPIFFGLEAMPLVERLQTDLDLLAINPQAENDDVARKFSADELMKTWADANERSFEIFAREGAQSNVRIDRNTALSAWRYNIQRDKFELAANNQAAFTPKIMFMREKGSLTAKTMFAWTLGIATVIPVTDWIAVVRKRKKLFGKEELEFGAIATAKINALVGSLLDNFEVSGVQAWLLREKNVATANKLMNLLEFELKKADLDVLAADKLRDTP